MDNMPYILQRKKMLEEMEVPLYPQPKNSKVDKYYYRHNLTNKHNYNITINEPNLCTEHREIFLLILIRTHYAHVKWREIIRELLNHVSPMPHRKRLIVKHLFIFANSNNQQIENLVRNESKHHRDIIQEDFPETYLNLLKKVVTAWKWTVNFCPNAEYVMITNDEVLVDVEKVVFFLLQDFSTGKYDDHFAICYTMGNRSNFQHLFPQFRKMDPKKLYKGAFYPPYCHGWAYAAHINIVNKLYKASLKNPPFMPTDVWIGLLAEKLRVKVYSTRTRYVISYVQRYFADPLYPIRPGMVAITDDKRNKNHEYAVMRNVINSMRKHWKRMANISIYLNDEPLRPPATFLNFPKIYTAITIFTYFFLSIFAMASIKKLLNQYGYRNLFRKQRQP